MVLAVFEAIHASSGRNGRA